MADLNAGTAIIPAALAPGEYTLNVKDFEPDGSTSKLSVPLPKDEKWGSILLRAALLKSTTWKNFNMPTVIHAVLYSDQLGLDIMAGDVYMAQEGRLSTSAYAKIKHGMTATDETGKRRITGYSVEIDEGDGIQDFTWKTSKEQGVEHIPNYHIKVTVHVNGWEHPVVYEATLREWFTPANPNWRTRPRYMLRLNALGKAFQEVAPMGVEVDEAPEIPIAEGPREAAKAALS